MFDFSEMFRNQLRAIEEGNRRLLNSAFDLSQHANRITEASRPGIDIELPKVEPIKIEPARIELPRFDFSSFVASVIDEAIKPIRESLDNLSTTMAKAAVVMFKNGWWLIHSLPIAFYSQVAANGDKVTREELTTKIVSLFNEDKCRHLAALVNGWHLGPFGNVQRGKIFQDALEGHILGKYTMTVPAIIDQVEGIIREFVRATDNNFTAWKFDRVRVRFRDRFIRISQIPEGRPLTFDELRAVQNYYNLAILEKLYGDYDPRQHKDPEMVNRNALDHGLWLNYHTIEASTWLFLLFDMLHSMLEQLTRDSKLQGPAETLG